MKSAAADWTVGEGEPEVLAQHIQRGDLARDVRRNRGQPGNGDIDGEAPVDGGEGGTGSEQALYAGEVQARLRTAWNALLAAEGAAIASAGSCGVTIAIDASGFASFSGWVTRPGDAHMAELVKRACAMIGNCGKPPAGKAFKIDFTNYTTPAN